MKFEILFQALEYLESGTETKNVGKQSLKGGFLSVEFALADESFRYNSNLFCCQTTFNGCSCHWQLIIRSHKW